MNLHDIEAFVTVAESGSVNRAAIRLNLTQPAVTRRVQSFEAAMGDAALLDRRVKPSVLTPAGRRALEGCRQVLKAVTELRASTSSGEPSGELRLGIAHGLTEVALGVPLDVLRQRFPRLRPRVTSHWTTWLIEQIRNGALDCAVGLVTGDHVVPPGVHAIAIGIERVVVVAARDTVVSSAAEGRLGICHLAGQNWILNPPGCGYRAALQRAFDHSGAPLRIAAEVSEHDLQLSLIARGGGLGLMPRRQIDNSPHRRRLRILKLDDFDLRTTVSMLHGTSLGSLAEAVEHLRSEISESLRDNRKFA